MSRIERLLVCTQFNYHTSTKDEWPDVYLHDTSYFWGTVAFLHLTIEYPRGTQGNNHFGAQF